MKNRVEENGCETIQQLEFTDGELKGILLMLYRTQLRGDEAEGFMTIINKIKQMLSMKE